ncbi:fumarate reductase/succinate dehydrogenase flavoprotein subunit [Meiothermus ruber]|jgi:succinate dehydrogenase / fumarate reductase flavoprotein subunit|uniref:Succinate dehydrogenase (Ubiquinone) n=1 Tax=Meiothermus ruber (strain ATCC 35948 / DSM 1279 / VKM B-1258 / 21) TaxID=504728 RepID=D3PMH5_MEIRD|nr:fumarate reductase/succinate dehydrogenase flavoprotein subunit [Meiothermus ruber]ADD29281.1 Succinate dehydrogenase (ubiquinone) [Meiothermus ruber DSM 1279]AGK05269.1 succinate dehydrogenase flavoprotein subunit [Meiothermus ruber DSM 1279]MCL6529198.1 fumarate reductase/succinate dehydrogenase flavoprotein subunit [Meiothermus ruber]
MESYTIHDYDVLVIGAGGAGLRAAIAAIEQGAKVGVVTKSLLGKAHTVMAEGGMAAAMGNVRPEDNWKVHFRDTLKGGGMLNNWKMVENYTKEAPDRVRELEQWGAVFDRTPDGRINQRNFGGHSYPRLAHVGDRTGLELIRTLQDHAVKMGIHAHMETTIYRLLTDAGRVVGALGFNRQTGDFLVFRAKAVVLATGGLGRIYQVTSNSWECTGDGFSLASMVGADLIDMEFIQFHPTGMVWPPSVMGILVTEGVRGEGGVLKNSEGRRFMFDNVPERYKGEFAETEEEAERWLQGDRNARRPPELLTRDVVARAIRKEVNEGRGSPHGGVFLDIASRRPADYIKKKLPSMYHQFMKLGNLDITKEPMEVGPTCHYVMGGVRVDPDTQATNVPGLYAAGEVAGGLHGANRLGGNSLSDLVVFGRRAGLAAAEYAAKQTGSYQVDEAQVRAYIAEALQPFNNPQGENPFALMKELRATMQKNAGIMREESELKAQLEILANLKKRAWNTSVSGSRAYNPGWHTALDMRLMVEISEAVVLAALARKESRGGHARLDYPDPDPTFAKINHIIRRKSDGTLTVVAEPLPEMPEELRKIAEAKDLKELSDKVGA